MKDSSGHLSSQVIIPTPEGVTFSEEIDVSTELKKLMHNKLRVVFFGTPHFVLPVLETLEQNFDLVCVVSTPDAKVGRKQILTSTPVSKFGEDTNTLVLKPEKLTEETAEALRKLQPDLFVVASYGKIIPQLILDVPRFGSINVHPSKLPEFRGATPIQSQLLAGVTDSAISFILVDAKMDHGPLLCQEPFTISESDTNETLHNSMFLKAAEILALLITDFVAGKIEIIAQNHDKATFCKPFTRDSGFFELENPPTPGELDRMIRAFYPWPTAWTKWKDKIIKFLPEKMVQPEGKIPMKWKDFLNGYKDFPNKELL
jgi:methionyl-tRNA formyltransferase